MMSAFLKSLRHVSRVNMMMSAFLDLQRRTDRITIMEITEGKSQGDVESFSRIYAKQFTRITHVNPERLKRVSLQDG